jgi:anthranilate synthase component I
VTPDDGVLSGLENKFLFPDFARFEKLYTHGSAQYVWRKVAGDLETPVSAYLKLRGSGKNSFLLESVEGGETLGRYSIIGLNPDLIWKSESGKCFIRKGSAANGDGEFTLDPLPVFDSLQKIIDDAAIDTPDFANGQLPPMSAGLFGYFAYDMIRHVEKLDGRPADNLAMPEGWFVRPSVLAVFDNVRQEINLITPVRPVVGLSADQAYGQAKARIDALIIRLQQPVPDQASALIEPTPEFMPHTSPQDFAAMVERAKGYIRAGDIFQVVLSQRFSAPFPQAPIALYRALRRLNPSPFLFYLDFEIGALIGSSPEILVRVRDNKVTIRPIAGTRPRGKTPEQDKALELELLADPKELSEHLMLLDLGRNDVGRSSRVGSVRVTDKFFVERYSHVMHVVSNVTGDLRDDVSPVQALMNGFPAGTVSGAPKIRAMEIIDELELEARGPYAGCIGYFSADGNVDSCIALRTAIVKDDVLYIQAGGGIVADSDPQSEQQECLNKAGALMSAAEAVWRGEIS